MGTKAQTLGMPLPGTSLKIVDANQTEVATGMLGRLWVAGPQVMLGYIGEESPCYCVNNITWLDTGLMGSLDDGGFLRLDAVSNNPVEQQNNDEDEKGSES